MVKQTTSYTKGKEAEQKARNYLISKGFNIVATNYKTEYGEIDIIACNNNLLVCFEVKFRKSCVEYAISEKQQKRITDAFMYFIANNANFLNHQLRFDAILINKTAINHIENAWGEDF